MDISDTGGHGGPPLRVNTFLIVIPAKTGIHLRVRVNERQHSIPNDAREPRRKAKGVKMDSGFRRNDGKPSLFGLFQGSNPPLPPPCQGGKKKQSPFYPAGGRIAF